MINKLKVGLVGVTQANFQGNKEKIFTDSVHFLKDYSGKLGFDFYHYPEFVVTGEDADQVKKAVESERVDFLLVQSTTFAAGEIINRLARASTFLGLWAIPETSFTGSNFCESTNSFCGVNMYVSIISNYLKDYSIKYKWFYGYTDHELFKKRFEITIRALTAIKKLKNSKVALIGGIAPGFNDLYFDERQGQKRLGIEIQRNHEFSEIKEKAHAYKDVEIKTIMEELMCGYNCTPDVSKESLNMHARYYKAYSDFTREYGYDALGISCWPKIQDENVLACSIIAKLNQNGIPAACEGDLPGAVSMLLQRYITEQPTTLLDLSGIDEEDQSVLMWHCGPSPECYANCDGSSLTYSYQPTDRTNIKKIGLISNMVFKPQNVTFMRITGEWDRMFLLDGKVMEGMKDSPNGSRGWISNLRLNRNAISVRDLMNTILVQGFQHHYPMMSGDITEELMEVAAWLDITMIEKVEYQNYLQCIVNKSTGRI